MDWEPLILGAVIFNALLLLLGARVVIHAIQDELLELDAKVAQAIKSIVEGGLGDFEPPNPIQMALAELLKSKIGQIGDDSSAIDIVRGDDGKFA